MILIRPEINTITKQIEGFLNTKALFHQFEGLEQFYLDKKEFNYINCENLIIEKQLPLGKRVEEFFVFLLKNSKHYNLLHNNIQIFENKNTLGELDFILEDKNTKIKYHIELVYKFYLYDTNYTNEFDRYIGQNRNDTFLRKINKLKNKQFPLLYKNETKKYLRNLKVEELVQKTYFLGHIFLPYKQSCEIQLNKECIKGFHININEFKKEMSFKQYFYFLPHRFHWLCDANNNETWKNYNDALEEIDFFLSLKNSPLVWINKGEKKECCFITWW